MKKDLVSVVIPVAPWESKENYTRTINSLFQTAEKDIEVVLVLDGWKEKKIEKEIRQNDDIQIIKTNDTKGERISVNEGVAKASGNYILKIDAHCSYTKNWDASYKQTCGNKNFVVPTMLALMEDTWRPWGNPMSFVRITPTMHEKWWGKYQGNNLKMVEPNMSFTGCGWFTTKKFFWEMGGFDNTLSKWGCIGPEVSVKIHRLGGEVLLRKNLACYHVFGTAKGGYSIPEMKRSQKEILKQYSEELWELYLKFKVRQDIPEWNEIHTKDDFEQKVKETLNN